MTRFALFAVLVLLSGCAVDECSAVTAKIDSQRESMRMCNYVSGCQVPYGAVERLARDEFREARVCKRRGF